MIPTIRASEGLSEPGDRVSENASNSAAAVPVVNEKFVRVVNCLRAELDYIAKSELADTFSNLGGAKWVERLKQIPFDNLRHPQKIRVNCMFDALFQLNEAVGARAENPECYSIEALKIALEQVIEYYRRMLDSCSPAVHPVESVSELVTRLQAELDYTAQSALAAPFLDSDGKKCSEQLSQIAYDQLDESEVRELSSMLEDWRNLNEVLKQTAVPDASNAIQPLSVELPRLIEWSDHLLNRLQKQTPFNHATPKHERSNSA